MKIIDKKKSALITITIAIFLISSLAISPLPAQALPTHKSAELNRVERDFGNPENRILIARRGSSRSRKGKSSKSTSGGSRRKSKKSIIDIGIGLAKLVWKSAEHHAEHDAKLTRNKGIRGPVF